MMLKYTMFVPAAIVCAVALPGCGEQSPVALVQEYNETLLSVTDEASAKKAAKKLKTLSEKIKAVKPEIDLMMQGEGDPELKKAVEELFAISESEKIRELRKKVPEFDEAMKASN